LPSLKPLHLDPSIFNILFTASESKPIIGQVSYPFSIAASLILSFTTGSITVTYFVCYRLKADGEV
jgi:hypothetical protein